MKSNLQRILENASAEVDTMAVWRALSLKDREKALKKLLGNDWRYLYRATIKKYQNSIEI